MKNPPVTRIECLEARIAPATFTVTTSRDIVNDNDGVLSLREAIQAANATAGPDSIVFKIPGTGVHRIALQSSLPQITDTVTIDGYSQPGASPNSLAVGNNAVLRIEIKGDSTAAGFVLQAGGTIIRGLVLNGLDGAGITISNSAGGQIIEGNFIGTDATGKTAIKNGGSGIDIFSSPNVRVGGTTPAARNVISGNDNDAIFIDGVLSSDCIIQGNYLGTDAAGTTAIPNENDAIFVSTGTPRLLVGGTSPGAGNLISGNDGDGISFNKFLGQFPNDSDVQGNLIGTDSKGLVAIPNNGAGVSIFGATNIRVGGTDPNARNVIAGNSGNGIEINAAESANNVVSGNLIGTGLTGGPLPNRDGVSVQNAGPNNTIGGSAPGAANVIAFNSKNGVTVSGSTTAALIIQNEIFSNVLLGIDLEGDGRTLNDSLDADAGANNRQNFPVLALATIDSSGLGTVTGTFNSTPGSNFTLYFYGNRAADGVSFGGSQVFLGSLPVSTDASGNAPIFYNIPAAPPGTAVTSTAVDASGNTSEFSDTVAFATSFVWDGSAGGGNWFTKANWSPQGIPGPTDSVLLNTSSFIRLGAPATVGSFTQTSGTLTGTGDLTVLGTLTWTGGTMSSTGVTHANGGLILNGGTVQLTSRTLDLPAGQTAALTGPGATLRFAGGALFENGGTFLAQNTGALVNAGGAASAFHNTGTFTRDTDTALFNIAVPFLNEATVNAATGTLAFDSGFSQSAGAKVIGTGLIEFAGGLVSAQGVINPDVLNSGAVLNPGGSKTAGTLTLAGSYKQTSSGTMVVELGGTTAGSLHDQLVVAGPATLDGTLKVQTLGGFAIAVGNSFPVILSPSVAGSFAQLRAPSGVIADVGNSGLTLRAQVAETAPSITFTDVDGDQVSVKVNNGAIPIDAVKTGPNGEIQLIDLRAIGVSLKGASVSILVNKAGGGNGTIDIGALDASGMDLKKLTIAGNLGQIDIGTGLPGTTALKSLIVNGLGAVGTIPQPTGDPGPLVSTVAGSLGALTVKGNVQHAALSVDGKLGKVNVAGDFTGEAGMNNALLRSLLFDRFDPRLAGGIPVASIAAGSIGTFSVKGSVTNAGVSSSGDIGNVSVGRDLDSGAVVAEGRIKTVKILGSMVSTDASDPVVVAALARSTPGKGIGLDVLRVKGDVENAEILLGYNKQQTAKNADASVGQVIVGGDWSASSLVAGVVDNTTDGFGQNDAVIPVTNQPGVVARIASVVIKGTATGSAAVGDYYGITAESIGKLSIDGRKVALSKGSKDDQLLDPVNGDFRVVEL